MFALFLLLWLSISLLGDEGRSNRLSDSVSILGILLWLLLGISRVLLSSGSFFFLWFLGGLSLFVLFGLLLRLWLLSVLVLVVLGFGLLLLFLRLI